MIKEINGQISAEYLLLVGSLMVVIILAIVFVANNQELSIAMSASRSGVAEGSHLSSSVIYPKNAYNEYEKSKLAILRPYSIDIINITSKQLGHDTNYDKDKIQFKVYAVSRDGYTKKELDLIGDRINYNLRKSIALSFNSTKSTNKLYNPVFSPHYVFTTANVGWV